MKRRRSLLYQVYPAYLVAILIALLMLSVAADRVFRDTLYAEKEQELQRIASIGATALALSSVPGEGEAERVLQLLGGIGKRLTIIAIDGRVVAETDHDPSGMTNHRDRPEVRGALAGAPGIAVRQSSTTGEKTLYVAVPVVHAGSVSGVVRAATSIERLDHISREIRTALVVPAGIILLAAALMTAIIIARVHRPLTTIRDAALRYAQGDLAHRIEARGPEEITAVAATLNGMAEQLSATIAGIRDQRNELEAVLASMVEGVIVVDAERRIRAMNSAAQRLFGKEDVDFQGRSLIDHVRNTDLDRFAGEVLETETYAEQTITLYRAAPVYIQVHGTLFRQGEERETRVLLVLNDITRLKQLEVVRRDFVANVSHELKTPVTAILGFVETLRDGLPEDPRQAARFLEIISVHANRLNLIIEDLLTLSRLESAEAGIEVNECPLDMVINRVLETCADQASQKNIRIRSHLEGDSIARVNENLLEQALVNLVNNAIKYSGEGSTVEIITRNDRDALTFEVRDTGQGIPAGDVPRIFERFFRVDRARSRELGGTGLGLAIVKHIAMAHGGEVTVESTEGLGSTFRLRLPRT
ncbi:MAG: HAMP domain-containing protein [Spirochaetaceae bacterium]|nr:MAG: HAMP domain-containing protein [Spirochaetaceae bacterium]